MLVEVIVRLEPQQRHIVRDLLPSVALAFPGRDVDESDDAEAWRTLNRLRHDDTIIDAQLLVRIEEAFRIAVDRLAAGADPAHWRTPDVSVLLGSTPPEDVLAEAAQLALRNAHEIDRILTEVRQSIDSFSLAGR